MSSGRLGPPRRAPSCRRRRKLARPPGPDSRSTALPMIACSSASQAWVVSGPGAPGAPPAAASASRSPAWRSLPSSVHSRTRSSSAAALTSPVTTGAIAASQAIASAASPSSHAPPSPPPSEAAARCAAHCGADLRGPLLLQGGAAVQPEQVGQRDVRPDLDRLTGPLRQQVRRDQAAHRLLQRVVVPLGVRPGVLGAGRGGQGIQDSRHDRGALRSQVTIQHAGALEGGHQLHAAVLERPRGVLIGKVRAGPLVDLGGQPGQVPQVHPRQRGADQDRVCRFPAILGELVGPGADRPGHRLRQLPRGQRGEDLRMLRRPPRPRGVGHGGSLGHPGLMDQPGPRTVIRVRGIPLPGGERRQDRGPCRRADRGRLLQYPQAACLLLGRHRRGIGGRQVAHRSPQHLQRLGGAGR